MNKSSRSLPLTAPLAGLSSQIISCRACPRLVKWRESVALNPPKRFAGDTYHARPVPGFGDPNARLLIVGLAPAAHGANRTGRMFTGDQSGLWLYRALHRAGFANQPNSDHASDGLCLQDAYITAACRCAPPDNKPAKDELANCAPFLDTELDGLFPRLRVIVPLGAIGLRAVLDALKRRGLVIPRPAPKFAHAAEVPLAQTDLTLLMSYHPSQQNTFTGLLTEPMFDAIWSRAKLLLAETPENHRAKGTIRTR